MQLSIINTSASQSVFLLSLHTKYLSVFSPNAGKYGPEKTPYLDNFHAVYEFPDVISIS